MTEKDTIIRLKDDEGNEYILYPATKAENIIGLKTVAISGSYNDLDNKPVNATTSKSGLMSNTDKSKLDGISEGANKTVVDTALSSTSTNPVQNKVMNTALNNKAPNSHASTATTYGTGTSSNYGHVKLSDSTSSTSSTGSGVAATPAAVKAAYDKAVSVQEDVVNMNDAFNSNGYAGAEEVVNDVSQIISEKIAPPTTITIANNTSKHKSYADYICTGTSDQTVINNAIAALPDGGGKIVLLEGTYNISGQITINKNNVTIEGMGASTVLNRQFNGSLIYANNKSHCTFTEFSVNGNSDTYTSTTNYTIYTYTSCSHINVHHIEIHDEAGIGIYIRNECQYCQVMYNILYNVGSGIIFDNCDSSLVIGNTILTASDICINMSFGSAQNRIFKNFCYGASLGITTSADSVNNIISDNYISDCEQEGFNLRSKNTIISNNIICNCSCGVACRGAFSTISGNNIIDSIKEGVYLDSSNVNLIGNSVYISSDTYESSQYTIYLTSAAKNCLVTGNIITGKNYVNNGGTTNTFANNKY